MGTNSPLLPSWYYEQATHGSFRSEGIDLHLADVREALLGHAHRRFRSRLSQRVRNHVAIAKSIELALQKGVRLTRLTVIRWYTSISCGLSTTQLPESRLKRLDQVLERINSPQLRAPAALQGIAHVHTDILNEELVPGFNGILARLLLHFHLGRCGFPPVIFEPNRYHPVHTANPEQFLVLLLPMIERSCLSLQNKEKTGTTEPLKLGLHGFEP